MIYESFQDIPQFPRSYYSVNSAWDHLERTIADMAIRGTLDTNPPYQRGYVWTQAQKERYVEYCLMGGSSGRDLYFNCPNWELTRPIDKDDWFNRLELVDGKQRLDAIYGFLHDEVLAFGKPASGYSGVLRMQHVMMNIHIGCLETPLQVVDWYLGMNNGGTAHTEKDLQVALDYRKTLL